jgi:hypothetical protein
MVVSGATTVVVDVDPDTGFEEGDGSEVDGVRVGAVVDTVTTAASSVSTAPASVVAVDEHDAATTANPTRVATIAERVDLIGARSRQLIGPDHVASRG